VKRRERTQLANNDIILKHIDHTFTSKHLHNSPNHRSKQLDHNEQKRFHLTINLRRLPHEYLIQPPLIGKSKPLSLNITTAQHMSPIP